MTTLYRQRHVSPTRWGARVMTWSLVLAVVGLIAFAVIMSVHAARADGTIMCNGIPGSVVCTWRDGIGGGLGEVIQVPPPESAELRAEAEQRERQWVARCHPTIVPDRYGVARYQYAAAGCEFGR